VGPQPEHLDGALVVDNLVDDATLDVDPAGAGAGQVSDEPLERRRSLVRVNGENGQYLLGLRTKPVTCGRSPERASFLALRLAWRV
jgi:hypothetical protein